MFTDVSGSLPTSPIEFASPDGVLGFVVGRDDNYALGVIVGSKPLTAIVQLPAYTDDIALIDVAGIELGRVEAVEVWDRRYVVSLNPSQLEPGEFIWDFYQHLIIVRFYPDALPPIGVEVKIFDPEVRTDYVLDAMPPIFSQYPLEGSFSWTTNWRGHPSGQMRFKTFATQQEQIARLLAPGTEFTAFGIGFRTGSPSITEIPYSENPMRLIEVSVPLDGRHQTYCDRIIPWRLTSTPQGSATEPDPACLTALDSTKQEAIAFPDQTSVAELARRAGDIFSGPAMTIPLSRDVTPSSGTTFINEAEARLAQNGCFLDFNDPNMVRAIALDSVPLHSLQESDIIGAVSRSISGRRVAQTYGGGSWTHEVDPVATPLPLTPLPPYSLNLRSEDTSAYPYAQLYDPRYRLTGQFFEEERKKAEGKNTQGDRGAYSKPEWKQHQVVRQTVPEGDDNPSTPPSTGTIKDLSNDFRQSGIRKKKRTTVLEDGLEVSSSEEEWGFVILGKDMFDNDGNLLGAAPNWQKIAERNTTHEYDQNTPTYKVKGYYLGSTTTGWELVSYRTESAQNPETLKLDTSDEVESKIYNLYVPFQNPYVKKERLYLEAMRPYYNDVPPAWPIQYKVCLPNGTSEVRVEDDRSYLEPYFVAQQSTFENNFKAIKDPESDPPDDPKPPITTGKESYHRERSQILPSESTNSVLTIPGYVSVFMQPGLATNLKGVPDAYNTYQLEMSAQDSQFSSSFNQDTFTRNSGRPALAKHKPPQWERVTQEPESASGTPANNTAPKKYNYFLTSNLDPFYTGKTVEGGTLNYPHAKTLEEALRAAQTEIDIKNIEGSVKEDLSTSFNPNMKGGDKLVYTVNGITRVRRMLSVGNEVRIQRLNGRPYISAAPTKMSLGLERGKTPMQLVKEEEPTTTTGTQGQVVNFLFVPDTAPTGEILDPGLVSRRNFTV